jgi:hypothetical protein
MITLSALADFFRHYIFFQLSSLILMTPLSITPTLAFSRFHYATAAFIARADITRHFRMISMLFAIAISSFRQLIIAIIF